MSLRKFLAGQNSRDEVAIMKNRCTSTMTLAFLLCFYYALGVFCCDRGHFEQISNRSGIDFQWNGGFRKNL